MRTRCMIRVAAVAILMGGSVSAQTSNLEVETTENITRVRNRLDFISHMGDPLLPDSPTTKATVIASLRRLTARPNRDCNPDLVKAWNLLDQTKALTPKEKADWVERHMSEIQPPFIMLAAVMRSKEDPKRGMELYMFGRLRLVVDAEKCADPSAQESCVRVLEILAPQLDLGVKREDVSEEQYDQQFKKLIRESKDAALRLYEKTANHATQPWWVAHAGLRELTRLTAGSSDESTADDPTEALLKPEKEWPGIEKEILDDFRQKV